MSSGTSEMSFPPRCSNRRLFKFLMLTGIDVILLSSSDNICRLEHLSNPSSISSSALESRIKVFRLGIGHGNVLIELSLMFRLCRLAMLNSWFGTSTKLFFLKVNELSLTSCPNRGGRYSSWLARALRSSRRGRSAIVSGRAVRLLLVTSRQVSSIKLLMESGSALRRLQEQSKTLS